MRLTLALLFAGLLNATTAPHVGFSAPTKIPATMPYCGGTPGDVTVDVIYEYTVYDCHNYAVGGGQITGAGIGYCSGFGHYCVVSIGGPIAPTFNPSYTVDMSVYPALYWIYVNITSIKDGQLVNGYGCGINHMTTGPHVSACRPQCY